MNRKFTALIILILFTFSYKVLFPYYNDSTADNLPEQSINFIKDYFDTNNITRIEELNEFYKVFFNNGIIIYFDSNGLWQEIDGHSNPIPTSFINKNVLNTIKNTNPNANIIKIKRRWNMYVVSLDNYINVFVDFAGMLIGQKVPD
ncbi:PepSY-like domain-containing protein [uncultured Brachyspira sp.]|uniref:PepSY-like domain-containing protein n=1 Tax=uncultured Brachyspira sp. TaxID=221953 RepID=UPI00261A3576|nr:PepSY-like domain-containing protein [uncultured Brachyspira sp.]